MTTDLGWNFALLMTSADDAPVNSRLQRFLATPVDFELLKAQRRQLPNAAD